MVLYKALLFLSSLTSKTSPSFTKHLQPARHPFKFNYFPKPKLQ